MVALRFDRSITRGMVGGALGAFTAFVVVSIIFLSRGPTAADSATNWSLPLRSIAFASLVPWVAGMSWTDLLTTIFLPGRSLWYVSITVVGLVIPPTFLLAGLVLFWRPQTLNQEKLKIFSLWFYGIVAAVFAALYIHGSTMGLEERYFRPVGILLFVCAAASAFEARTPQYVRGLFLALCALMVLYGLASFSSRALATASGRSLDRTSWTNQQIYDSDAVDFVREAYAREGRNALFVLPTPQISVTLPTGARILTRDIEWGGPAASLPGSRYSGRVPSHLYVLIPNNLVDTSRARELLSAFTDYAPDGWERKAFANMSVFFQ
jgi:hypothetical protein